MAPQAGIKMYLKDRMNKAYHCAAGLDCTFWTPPSTGTAMVRFSKGDGLAIAWLLYL